MDDITSEILTMLLHVIQSNGSIQGLCFFLDLPIICVRLWRNACIYPPTALPCTTSLLTSIITVQVLARDLEGYKSIVVL